MNLSRLESGRNPARKSDFRPGSSIAQHRVFHVRHVQFAPFACDPVRRHLVAARSGVNLQVQRVAAYPRCIGSYLASIWQQPCALYSLMDNGGSGLSEVPGGSGRGPGVDISLVFRR